MRKLETMALCKMDNVQRVPKILFLLKEAMLVSILCALFASYEIYQGIQHWMVAAAMVMRRHSLVSVLLAPADWKKEKAVKYVRHER